MKMIVADSAGDGVLQDEYGEPRALSPTEWTETDARDTVTAIGSVVYVRYRHDGHTVEVPPGQSYQPEVPDNPDVIDVRSASDAAEQLRLALYADPTLVPEVFSALEMAPHDHNRVEWINQLRFAYHESTGVELDGALRGNLDADDFERAEALLR